ncbi:hypothetical protein C8J57DRAFT_1459783 [Mycena rebaudengoi]|nr:hypothetical protein C8J57DRAFT_1459783 [Mycena rebaudengoi]
MTEQLRRAHMGAYPPKVPENQCCLATSRRQESGIHRPTHQGVSAAQRIFKIINPVLHNKVLPLILLGPNHGPALPSLFQLRKGGKSGYSCIWIQRFLSALIAETDPAAPVAPAAPAPVIFPTSRFSVDLPPDAPKMPGSWAPTASARSPQHRSSFLLQRAQYFQKDKNNYSRPGRTSSGTGTIRHFCPLETTPVGRPLD